LELVRAVKKTNMRMKPLISLTPIDPILEFTIKYTLIRIQVVIEDCSKFVINLYISIVAIFSFLLFIFYGVFQFIYQTKLQLTPELS
jgi:hypothetical protein